MKRWDERGWFDAGNIDGTTYIYGILFLILFGGESTFFFFRFVIDSYPEFLCRVVQVANKFSRITVINPMIKYAELYK